MAFNTTPLHGKLSRATYQGQVVEFSHAWRIRAALGSALLNTQGEDWTGVVPTQGEWSGEIQARFAAGDPGQYDWIIRALSMPGTMLNHVQFFLPEYPNYYVGDLMVTGLTSDGDPGGDMELTIQFQGSGRLQLRQTSDFATWDPNYMSDGVSLSEDKLTATLDSTDYEHRWVRTTIGSVWPTAFEVMRVEWAAYIGFATYSTPPALTPGSFMGSWAIYPYTFSVHVANGTRQADIGDLPGPNGTTNYQILWHPDGRVWVRKNGVYLATSAGEQTENFEEATPVYNGMPGTQFWPMIGLNIYNGFSISKANFGQRPWRNQPPAGFYGVYQDV